MGREYDPTLHLSRNERSSLRMHGRFYLRWDLLNSSLLCGSRWRRRFDRRGFQGRLLLFRTKSDRRRATLRSFRRIIRRRRNPMPLRWSAFRSWSEGIKSVYYVNYQQCAAQAFGCASDHSPAFARRGLSRRTLALADTTSRRYNRRIICVVQKDG